jgi:type 1 fimbriae regulatory protein FimB
MSKTSSQVGKVEQSAVGELLDLRPRLLKVAPEKKGTSPNKGHEATGRTREYLTPSEMERLLDRAKKYGRENQRFRNHCIILTMYRHGLRVGEAANLKWSDICFDDGTIYIRRLKGSNATTQYIEGDEMRSLRRLQREQADNPSPFVFGGLATTAIASTIKRIGKGLFGFPIHSHMIRHSAGYALANKGVPTRTIQEFMGHTNIETTVIYTRLSPVQFKGLWD